MLVQQRSPIIRGTGKEVRDHIFIDDVVRANLQVLDLGHNQTFNISSGQGYSLNQLFQIISSLLNSSIEPTYLFSFTEEKQHVVLDNTQAQLLLQWQPEVSLQTGIQRLLAEMKPHNASSTHGNAIAQLEEDDPAKHALTMA
jgi:UDP-glucose 4-epimerase